MAPWSGDTTTGGVVEQVSGRNALVTFSVVVPKELADRLTAIAKARGSKRSQLARVLLAEGAERHERIQQIANSIDTVGAAAS